MNNDELIEYAIRTSKTIKEEVKPKLIDYFYKQKEVIDKATNIINDYLKEDYSIYTENEIEVDLIVKLKNILKEASE